MTVIVHPEDLERLRVGAQHFAWGATTTMPVSAAEALARACETFARASDPLVTIAVGGQFADYCDAAAHEAESIDLPERWHAFVAERMAATRQPREQAVTCMRCRTIPTWNHSAVCDLCGGGVVAHGV